MPKPFPEPNITASQDIVSYANTVTDNWMTTMFAFAFVVIVYLVLHRKNYRNSYCMLAATMLGVVINSFLWAIDLLPGKIVLIILLLMIASGIYASFDN